jgi:hypothetical protein
MTYTAVQCSLQVLQLVILLCTGRLQNMIPKMPALIPANTVAPNPIPEAPPTLPAHRIAPTDDQLHQDLDNQIQLVKQIETMLGTEQIKLQMIMKQMNTHYMKKRKETTELANQKLEPKRLRVCSPSYINRNLSIERCLTMPVEKNSVIKNPDSGEAEKASREKAELERFRNFWSSGDDVFEDEEIEIKEELNTFDIADLVEEELSNRR